MTIKPGDLLKTIQLSIPYYGIYIGEERSDPRLKNFLVFDLEKKRMCYHESMWDLMHWWEKVETSENR
jgi:hypothetical protein